MKKINNLYFELISDYGNTAYIAASGDEYLNSIPDKINSAWYSMTENSFRTISQKIANKDDSKEIESDILALIAVLEEEFSKLKKERD